MIDPTQLRHFVSSASAAHAAIGGVRFTFRGATVIGRIDEEETQAELVDGGVMERGVFRARLPASVTPPPAIREKLVEVATGRKFVVTGVDAHNSDQSLRTWHTVRMEMA